jgi:hypothetical protein
MKRRLAILLMTVGILVSVFAAGCMSPINTPSSAPSKNQTFKAIINEYYDINAENETINAWKSVWTDSNTVSLDITTENTSNSRIKYTNETLTWFKTVDDATNYVNSQVDGSYKLFSSVSPQDTAYSRATGHTPSTYVKYTKTNEQRVEYSDVSFIVQSDYLVEIGEIVTYR